MIGKEIKWGKERGKVRGKESGKGSVNERKCRKC